MEGRVTRRVVPVGTRPIPRWSYQTGQTAADRLRRDTTDVGLPAVKAGTDGPNWASLRPTTMMIDADDGWRTVARVTRRASDAASGGVPRVPDSPRAPAWPCRSAAFDKKALVPTTCRDDSADGRGGRGGNWRCPPRRAIGFFVRAVGNHGADCDGQSTRVGGTADGDGLRPDRLVLAPRLPVELARRGRHRDAQLSGAADAEARGHRRR